MLRFYTEAAGEATKYMVAIRWFTHIIVLSFNHGRI